VPARCNIPAAAGQKKCIFPCVFPKYLFKLLTIKEKSNIFNTHLYINLIQFSYILAKFILFINRATATDEVSVSQKQALNP